MAAAIGTAILSWIGASSAFAASAIVTVGAATITVAEVVGAIAIQAVAVGLSYVERAVAGKPKANDVPGASGNLQSGGVVPRTFFVGYGMTGGKLAYANTWGQDGKTPNAYLSMEVSLSDLPITSLEGILVNDEVATYGAGTPDSDLGYAIPEYNRDGEDYLWVKFYDGTQTAADNLLRSKFGTDTNYPYQSTRVGYGVAYAVVTVRVNRTLFGGSPPKIKFILNGCKFYDPRKDTSIGGDGAHRFDDQSTWEFTQNPKVIEYNIFRGLTYNGKWFYGLQNMASSRLPLSSWVAAMNECDLEVDNKDGGTSPQYRCGGEIAVNVRPADVSDELNKCCNGCIAEIGGTYKTRCGAPGSAVFSFTDEDLLTTEQQTFDQFPGLSDLINAITASHPDPAQSWELSPAPGRYSDTFEAEDGDRQLISDVQYNMVWDGEQVQRLMDSALKQTRRGRKHTIPLGPGAWPLEPLDIAAWTSLRNGYTSKKFQIDLATDMDSLDVIAVITEVDPSDYNWTPDTDYIPVASGTIVTVRPPAQAIAGFTAEAVTIYGDDGRAKAGIKLEWTATGIDDVDGVLYQVRLKSDSSPGLSGETAHSVELFQTGNAIISENLSSGTLYQVRGKYRAISTRETTWSDWVDVTTNDIRLSAQDIYDNAIDWPALSLTLQDLNYFIGQGARDTQDKLDRLTKGLYETALGSSSDLQVIRQTLSSAMGTLTADYTNLIYVATGPDSAIAQQVESLQATVNDADLVAIASTLSSHAASISSNASGVSANAVSISEVSASIGGGYSSSSTVASAISAQSSSISTNASNISTATSQLGNFYASGLFRVSTNAALNGASSTIALAAAASSGGSASTAALYMSAMSGGASQIILAADKIYMTDGTNFQAPFLFSGGALYANSAIIPNISADKITTGELVTDRLEDKSVTNPIAEILTSDYTASWSGSTNYTPISTASKSFTPHGTGAVSITVSLSYVFTNGNVGTNTIYMSVVRYKKSDNSADSTLLVNIPILLMDVSSGGNPFFRQVGARSFEILDTAPPTHEVYYNAFFSATFNTTVTLYAGSNITIKEYKK